MRPPGQWAPPGRWAPPGWPPYMGVPVVIPTRPWGVVEPDPSQVPLPSFVRATWEVDPSGHGSSVESRPMVGDRWPAGAHAASASEAPGQPSQLQQQQQASDIAAALCGSVPDLVRHSQRGDIERVTTLLDSGQDPSAPDDYGFTALHGASKKGHVEVARLLIQARADINAACLRGETPLHYVCKYGQEAVARMLLESAAEVGAVTSEGLTPVELARSKNQTKLVDLVAAHSAP
mmetsp:Transcript_28995/g.57876  ORF Transcript_28995/g.57876 Transcript_28995/m.57876 type:complete len:234 (-) Transcript_28995:26-727(-)